MQSFDDIYGRALERKGEEKLNEHLPVVLSSAELASTPDHRFLSNMTRVVFAAGFRWRVIQAKWDGFEHAFEGFEPATIAAFTESDAERLRQDTRIVRNPQKIKTTIANAQYIEGVHAEHGSFAKYIADWPEDDIIGLWDALRRDGSRLGGATGPRFLRISGKDTFILTNDVAKALTEQGVMTAKATSQRGRKEAQAAFLKWRDECGRPMSHISMIIAMSVVSDWER